MKLAMHGHSYKATALGGLDRHNRRLNRDYGNTNIDPARQKDNIILIAPKASLYRDAKERIAKEVLARGGRVTKASNWVTEFIIYGLPDMGREEARQYFTVVADYFGRKVGYGNILSAVVHGDEAHYHMHLDFTPITADGRLSSKRVMTRAFLLSLHSELPQLLRAEGYDIERGEPVREAERRLKGRSAQRYKSEIEAEKAQLVKQCKTARIMHEQLQQDNVMLAHKVMERHRDRDLKR